MCLYIGISVHCVKYVFGRIDFTNNTNTHSQVYANLNIWLPEVSYWSEKWIIANKFYQTDKSIHTINYIVSLGPSWIIDSTGQALRNIEGLGTGVLVIKPLLKSTLFIKAKLTTTEVASFLKAKWTLHITFIRPVMTYVFALWVFIRK